MRHEPLTTPSSALVEGIHFDRAFVPPAAIGHRALAVNLSDLAAMGAAPRLALLSMALPPHLPLADFDAIIAGMAALAATHGVHVAGGNLTRSPGPLMLDVTVMGTVKRRQALLRGGARPGDDIYVSGSIGAAGAGLEILRGGRTSNTPQPSDVTTETSQACEARFLFPEPRIRLGLLLSRNRAASACVDLSDGLSDGLHRIAESSGVGVAVDEDAVPVAPTVRAWYAAQGKDPVAAAIAAGDDYELLFTVRPRTGRRLTAARRHSGTTLTKIGVCTKEHTLLMRTGPASNRATRELPRVGYDHFR